MGFLERCTAEAARNPWGATVDQGMRGIKAGKILLIKWAKSRGCRTISGENKPKIFHLASARGAGPVLEPELRPVSWPIGAGAGSTDIANDQT
ncbi:hypothetical protein ACFU99_06015 [Streptomyces sp. NPDC057654]|uniref:hypothetical protein n=1 Tax=Streptomyces sp. NPDC057654 TaxID=3346196 RepID=UPI003681094A